MNCPLCQKEMTITAQEYECDNHPSFIFTFNNYGEYQICSPKWEIRQWATGRAYLHIFPNSKPYLLPYYYFSDNFFNKNKSDKEIIETINLILFFK